jgi:hypothetical protein
MKDQKLSATGAASKPFAHKKSCAGMSSPGGKETGEGELNTDFSSLSVSAPLREASGATRGSIRVHPPSGVSLPRRTGLCLKSPWQKPFDPTQPNRTRLDQIEVQLRKKIYEPTPKPSLPSALASWSAAAATPLSLPPHIRDTHPSRPWNLALLWILVAWPLELSHRCSSMVQFFPNFYSIALCCVLLRPIAHF